MFGERPTLDPDATDRQATLVTMDDFPSALSSARDRLEDIKHKLQQGQIRARELVEKRHHQVAHLEQTVLDHTQAIKDVARQCRDRESEMAARQDELAAAEQQLAHERGQLEDDRQQLLAQREQTHGKARRIAGKLREQRLRQRQQNAQDQAAREQTEAEYAGQLQLRADQIAELQQRCDAAAAALEQQQQAMQQARAERDSAASERDRLSALVEAAGDQQQELEKSTDALQEQLAQEREARNAAEQQRDASAEEIVRLRECHQDLERQLADRQADDDTAADERESLRDTAAQLSEQLDSLRNDCEGKKQQILELQSGRDALAESLRDTEQKLLDAGTTDGQSLDHLQRQLDDAVGESDKLKRQNAYLIEQLEEARKSQTAEHAGDASQDELEELERRYVMAVSDAESLKIRVTELEHELQQIGNVATVAADTGDGALDWEAQKRRLLAELDADTGSDNFAGGEQRFSVEEAIRRTDEAVAAKEKELEDTNRQIKELEQQLATKDQNAQQSRLNQAEIDAMLNDDEIVSRERDRLQQLQTEWEEKLRQAEIEISVERAKLGRERAKLEDQLQVLRGQTGSEGKSTESMKSSKPGGRWLARLGLKDPDDD